MTFRILRLLALSSALLAPPLAAESIRWETALAEAGRANTDLLKTEQDLRQAELSVRVARAAFLPSASVGASLGDGGSYKADGVPGTFGDGHDSSSAHLGASWNLFNGFGDLASLASAKAQLRSAEASAQAARATAGFQLRSAFLTLQQAQERVTQAQDTAKRRSDDLDMVRLRFESGNENKGSVLQTQAQSEQADADLRKATRARLRAAQDLARLLGRDPMSAESLEAAGELAIPELPAEGSTAVEGLPSVVQAVASRESAEQDLRRQRGGWLPSLDAAASVGRSGGDWLSEDGAWSAGLSLNLPLFNGGSQLAQTQASASRLEAARLLEAAARRQAAVDLQSAYDALADAVDGAKVEATFLEAGAVRAEVASAQYAQGLLGFEDWDRVVSDYISVQQQALSSRGDAQRALAAWDRSLGRNPWP
jgi:outer membrane protein TolC